MQVLVAGGGGYIGCWLCQQLVERGHHVRVVDKGLFPRGIRALAEISPPVEVIRADVSQLDPRYYEGTDAAVCLSGLSNDPTAQRWPQENRRMNVHATVTMARQAKHAGIRRFTFASSASVYGFSHKVGLTEDDEVNPQSYYAQSKLDAERELISLAGDGFEPVILRQATVSGWSPRMRWDLVVNTMVMWALLKGTILSLIHI